MTDTFKETTIQGTRYRMRLLGGEDAVRAACIVTGPAFRAIDTLIAKLDLTKGLEGLGVSDIAALPAVAAQVFESIGYHGIVALTKMFSEQTTVFVPSGVQGDTQLHPVPMTNRTDHFVGKWPAHLAWLGWAVMANGFFDVSGILDQLRAVSENAKAVLRSQKASTGSSGG
jgi:hypothetical protein